MKKWLRVLTLWAIMGMLYFFLEGIWRIPKGGWANIVMAPIGGLCGVAVGGINQLPRFYRLPVILQALLGTVIVLVVEFLSGCVLNLWLQLEIWDYSTMPLNLLGQVCVPFALLWFLIMPFVIWLEDTLRCGIWRECRSYSLGSIYRELFTLR